MSRAWWRIGVVLMLVIASALAVIRAKHQSRKLFSQLQALKKQQDALDVEWGKLQLEQSAWARHERIERIARTQLDMKMPEGSDIVVIRP